MKHLTVKAMKRRNMANASLLTPYLLRKSLFAALQGASPAPPLALPAQRGRPSMTSSSTCSFTRLRKGPNLPARSNTECYIKTSLHLACKPIKSAFRHIESASTVRAKAPHSARMHYEKMCGSMRENLAGSASMRLSLCHNLGRTG